MESESEEGGLSHTGPLSRGLLSSRKSVGRCLTLQPQRVPISSIGPDNNWSGDEDGLGDTATPSGGSASIGTVSAILAANRRLERNPSGDPPVAADSCPDKENTAGRRLAHPYDLLTPLPRRCGPPPTAGRTPRQPLGRLDTPEPAPPAPASSVKRGVVFGEPSAEKRPPLQHASRSHSTLPAAERPAPGLSRGLSEGRLTGVGPLRRSLPVLAERPPDGTPPEQRVSQLNQSGSAPAAGPASRVSPATSGTAGTPRPPSVAPVAGQPQDARHGYTTPYRAGSGQQVAGKQAAQQRVIGDASGGSQTSVGATQTGRAAYPAPHRSTAPQGAGGEQNSACPVSDHRRGVSQVPPVSRVDGVDGTRSHRKASRQEAPGALAQQRVDRLGTSGAASTLLGLTATSAHDVAVFSHRPSNGSVTGPRSAGLYTSASASVGHSRLGLSATSAVITSSSITVVSASSVRMSSYVSCVSSSVSSASCSGLPVSNCGLPVSSSGLYVTSSGAPVLNSGSAVSNTQLPVSSSELPVSSSVSCVSSSVPPVSSCQLPVSSSGLPVSSSALSTVPAGVSPVRAASPAGQSGTVRPPPRSDSGTQTEESAAAAMPPPPPTELGKRQLRTVTVNQRHYTVIKQIGRGGSSKVYQVFDSELHSLAIKQVFLENTDDATASGYKNEIALLRSLQHSDRVVRLIDYELRADRQMLYIVMEKGDTDLTSLLRTYTRLNEVDANWCKFFWAEMLRCVDVIHKKNIVHSDLKPSNFLLVAGRLKLIDFGIASQIQSDCTSVIKDSQVGTFNYMSPEAIEAQQVTRNGASRTAIKISRRSDVWSLGCILYNFVYGITPFGHIKQTMGKLMAIVNPQHEIEFPPVSDRHLLSVLRGCLQRDPYQRPSIEQLLSDPYLTG